MHRLLGRDAVMISESSSTVSIFHLPFSNSKIESNRSIDFGAFEGPAEALFVLSRKSKNGHMFSARVCPAPLRHSPSVFRCKHLQHRHALTSIAIALATSICLTPVDDTLVQSCFARALLSRNSQGSRHFFSAPAAPHPPHAQ